MAKGIIRLLLAFCFIFFVNSKKTGGAELSSAEEERIPWEIFMKDEPRRQDSNEESLRAMHLCMEEEDRKELLITCDRRYSSKFACVGALEGNIQKCDRFEEKQVAVPICVQVESSYISICQYKNLASVFLCSPRNLNTQMSDYKEYRNSGKFSKGLREDIRVCGNRERRICLANEALLPCGDIEEFRLKISEIVEIFVKNTSTLENFENSLTYKSIKSENDNRRFRDDIQNGSYHTNDTNNYTVKYKTINLISPHKEVTKIFIPRERLPFEFDTNKRELIAGETIPKVQSDVTVVANSLAVERSKIQVNSNLKSKTLSVVSPQRDISEFSDPYESIFTLKSSTDSSKFKSVKLESLFPSDKPDASDLIFARGKINPELKHKVNVLTPERGDSKSSTFEENIYHLKSAINETEFIPGNETESISKVPKPRKNIAPLPISEAETGYISQEIKLYEDEKEFPLIKKDFVVSDAVHYINEREFVTEGFKTPIELNADQSVHKYKRTASPKEESIESSPSDSARMKAQREKRSVEQIHGLKDSKREPAYAFRAFYQAQPKKKPCLETTTQSSHTRSKPRPTAQSSHTRRFFHVLKCKDCDINNEMVVSKDAVDVIPEVETWIFKP